MVFELIHTARAAETAAPQSVTQLLGLDWKLFLAQLVNFGIVLFALTKYVFKPLGKRLQDRTTRIDESLAEAKRIEEEKAHLQVKIDKELTKARTQAAKIITDAKSDAEQLGAQMLLDTKLEQDRLVHATRAQLVQEADAAVKNARGQLSEIVTLATEKVLRQKIDKTRDEKLIKEMLEQINS